MKIYTPYADITGDGAKHSLVSLLGITSQECSWYQLSFVDNSSGNAGRLGDENISANQGIPFGGDSGNGQFAPVNGQDRLISYNLKDVFVIIPSGDVVSVAYAI